MANSLWNRLPVITKNLILINFICWFVDILFTNRIGIPLSNILGLHYFLSEGFGWWQLLTYMFMHANFSHIFFNMFAILMFAPELERRWGSQRFLIYYLVTGLGAGIVQELVWYIFYGSAAMGAITIGASGAVFGVLFAFGWLFPDVNLYLFFVPIPISARTAVILYAICELFLGVASLSGDNVAHFAHLGGMLFGWLLILWWKHRYGSVFASTPYESRLLRWLKDKFKNKNKNDNPYDGWHYQDPV